MLSRLSEGGVDYVVIGGVAVAFQGYGRSTKDLDIVYASDPDNLAALGEVLIAAKARLRGVKDDVPFVPDARTLRLRRSSPSTRSLVVWICSSIPPEPLPTSSYTNAQT
jgi:hypothetical protein